MQSAVSPLFSPVSTDVPFTPSLTPDDGFTRQGGNATTLLRESGNLSHYTTCVNLRRQLYRV